jgi:hypothetical protein
MSATAIEYRAPKIPAADRLIEDAEILRSSEARQQHAATPRCMSLGGVAAQNLSRPMWPPWLCRTTATLLDRLVARAVEHCARSEKLDADTKEF